MEALPADIHDYIITFYIHDLDDYLTMLQVSTWFVEAANRYRLPLRIVDKQMSPSKWLKALQLIAKFYRNIHNVVFRRCNITEQAFIALLVNDIQSVDLRECRYIQNHTKWLSQSTATTLALAKCSKLPDFVRCAVGHNLTYNNLRCLLIDRQDLRQSDGSMLASRCPHIRTLVMTNSSLQYSSLDFIAHFKHLKCVFLAGSTLFGSWFKRSSFTIRTIFQMMRNIDATLQKTTEFCVQRTIYDEKEEDEDDDDDENVDNAFNDESAQQLIQTVTLMFDCIHKLYQNGLKVIGVSFLEPGNVTLSQLISYQQSNRSDIHFDGDSIVRLIFYHFIHKYYAKHLTILDLVKYYELDDILQNVDYVDDIKLAMDYVFDVAIDEFGQTILHLVSNNGDTKHCQQILKMSDALNVEIRDKRGTTPLFYASLYDHYQIADLLIKRGANVFKRKLTKETPVEIACMRSNMETVRVILAATPNHCLNNVTKYDNEWSPVHCAVISGNLEMLRLLIEHGLDCALQNHWKQSALHITALKNYTQCAKLLIDRYDVNQLMLRDEFGKTAQSVAHNRRHMEIVHMIKNRLQRLDKHHHHRYNDEYDRQWDDHHQTHWRQRERGQNRGNNRYRNNQRRSRNNRRQTKTVYVYRPKQR